MTSKDAQIDKLQEEISFLREERRKSVEALDMAANLGRFDTGPGSGIDQDFILHETAQKLSSLIDFKALCFYLVDQKDNNFKQYLCDPAKKSSFFEKEINRLIEDHTFAWVLRRGKPVVIKSSNGNDSILLRSMTTPSRVRGMFAGVLNQDKNDISDTSYSLFSIVILSSTSALESIETYEYMRSLNNKLQEQAQESQKLYQDIFENAPMAIFRTSPQGRFLKVNPKYAEIVGFESPEYMVSEVTDIGKQLYYNPSDRDEYTKILNKDGHVLNYEVQLKRSDGTPFWASMNSRVVYGQDGTPLYYDGFLIDITGRKHDQDALIKAKEEAETANKVKSEFLANMSHELRTPLNGMLGMLQLLEQSTLKDQQAEFVDLAIKAGERLTELLSNILDLCKIEKGKIVVEDKPMMIKAIFDQVFDAFSLICQEKGIDYNVQVDEKIPSPLLGDAIRVKNILFNLVGNALKFTNSGEVKLRAYLLNNAHPGCVNVLFIIKDSGVGISEDMQEAIFEPFTQAEGSYTRKFQGAGLGLSVVKRMVNILKGNISFESHEDKGTSFYISLPFKILHTDSMTDQTGDLAAAQGQGNLKKRILVVEDEPTNLFFAQKMLDKLGYDTMSADDGTSALSILEKESFDCILMDVQLKKMDGVQATKMIRNHDGSKFDPDIPIIAATSYAMECDRDRFMAAGMNNYLSKPLRTVDLKSALEKVFTDTDN
ncbi:MAG: response regulator [Desulfonatronovibrio sp.]